MRFSAVIFDLDGVLVETEHLWQQADELFIKRYHLNVPGGFLATFKGRRQTDIIADYRRVVGLVGDTNALIRERSKIIKTIIRKSATLIPGARDFLLAISTSYPDVQRAIASSSPHDVINAELRHFGLFDFFSLIISGEDVPRGKPDPDVYLHVAGKLAVEPGDCLVFEDSASGIRAAKAAGMTCIAFEKPYVRFEDSRLADRVVRGFADLTQEYLESL
jgi:HAD superfamily hydrolase (TIGR01509 family)